MEIQPLLIKSFDSGGSRENKDEVAYLISNHIKNSPQKKYFDQNYLIGICRQAHLNAGEVKQMLNSKNNGEEIVKLLAVALLTKIRKNNLIHSKYFDFLGRVLGLLKSGRIKMEVQFVKKIDGDAGSCYYIKEDDLIRISLIPQELRSPDTKFNLEEAMVHELFHAYQDFKKEKKALSLFEAEAHLVAHDYMYYAYPDRAIDSWIKMSQYGESFSLGFSVPKIYIEKMSGLDIKDPEYRSAIANIAERYLLLDPFNQVFFGAGVDTIMKQIGDLMKKNRLGTPQQMWDQFDKIIKGYDQSKNKPVKITKIDGEKVTYQYSGDFLTFLAIIRIAINSELHAAHYAGRQEGIKNAQDYLTGSFEAFCKKTGKLFEIMDPRFDRIIQNDGIR